MSLIDLGRIVIIGSCIFWMFLSLQPVNGLKLCFDLKSLLIAYSQEAFRGLDTVIGIVEQSTLLDFVRLRRYGLFNFEKVYTPPPERNEELLEGIIQGRIPEKIINDLVDLKVLIKSKNTLKSLLDRPHLMKRLYITANHLDLHKLPVEEVKQILALIVKHQYRKIYSSSFYRSLLFLHNMPIIVDENNWEFFDNLTIMHSVISAGNLKELINLLGLMATKNNFALFRLSTLRIAAFINGLSNSIDHGPLKMLRVNGSSMQKIILGLGDCLLVRSHYNELKVHHPTLKKPNSSTNTPLFTPLPQDIDKLYNHFKKLLNKTMNDSPAFLLELLATTVSINTEEKITDLLEDLFNSYPPEKISPFYLRYILDYFPFVAQEFRTNRDKFTSNWKKLFTNHIILYRYYFPRIALTEEELVDIWRINQGNTIKTNSITIDRFFKVNQVQGVFKIVENQFYFVCDESFNEDVTWEFILTGLDFTALGSNDFLGRLPKELLFHIAQGKNSYSTLWPDGHLLRKVCVGGTATLEKLARIIDIFRITLRNSHFPIREFFGK